MKVFLVLAATISVAFGGTIDPSLQAAVDNGETQAILELPQIMRQIESNPALRSLSGDSKVHALVKSLQGLTSASQAPLVSVALSLGLETEQFWASNIILINGLTPEKLSMLGKTPGDFTIRKQHMVSIHPAQEKAVVLNNVTQTPQWGVQTIRAPEAWNKTQGEGVVVAIIDTGVNLGHVALADGYGGAWLDPYYSTLEPTDQRGHGSHCTGTILGRANGVGVAPAARWIACRGLSHHGSGSENALTKCAEFMLTANPRPHVVSNSWGGGSGDTWFSSQISAWRNAGIIPVFSIGNSGSSCGTANSPGDQPNLISVGATTSTDAMADFSSRGPKEDGTLKPEVSAPGDDVISCGTGSNNYVSKSGTSMACPHTAGAVALLLSANPDWGFDQVLNALTTSAAHPTLSNADRNCGLPNSPNEFPNYAFGHGRIDVAAALGL